MKNIYKFAFFLLLCSGLNTKLNAQIVNIPDANFKAALLAHGLVIDTNGDGEIQVSEAQALNGSLSLNSKNIADLTGIEAFTSLTGLSCRYNQLSSLNLSANTALTYLDCDNNQLTSLNLATNTALTYLDCYVNQLTSLNLTANTALTGLGCGRNQLTSLDLSANTALTTLSCEYNQLTSLDLTANTFLESLWCGSNQLSTINLNGTIALTYIHCSYNQLTSLDLTANTALTNLFCPYNQLLSLNLNFNIALTELTCSNNQLTSLDLTANTALTYLYCLSNQLISLDLRNGNNRAISSYYSADNPNLVCVSVDEPVWSANNWNYYNRIDPQTQFSSNCNCGVYAIQIDSLRHVTCSDSGYARASVTGTNGPFQYEWLNAPLSSDSILIADTAGLYTLKVTDVNQCESFLKVIIKEPKVKTGFELNTNLHTGVFRPGRFTSVDLTAWNDGCTVKNGQLRLVYNGPLSFESSAIPPTSQSGDTLSWDLGNMEYDLSNFLTSMQFRVDTLAQAGDRVCFELMITPLSGDADSTNNFKSYCFDVRNSYDPNDKQVYPQGVCAENYTLKNQPLTYTIRFQNTGNAPAIDVYLIDSLSPYLNLHSLRVLKASHEGLITEVLENDILKFDFKNINLADSLSDEAGSKGFVTYQIEPYTGLNENTVIENSAGIYFDFNAPVITNTTRNTLVSVLPQITSSTISETVCGTTYTAPNHRVYSSSGVYTAVVQNAFGCDSTITINLVVNQPSNAIFTESVCQQFVAADGQIFTSSGNYLVTIPNSLGCDSIINYQLTINKVDTSIAIIYPIIASNAFGAVYQWLDCQNGMSTIPGATNQYYSVPNDGIFAVSVSQNGCTDTSACVVMNLGKVDPLNDYSAIKLYPNPTNSLFNLDLGQAYPDVTISITDVQGKEIKKVKSLEKQEFQIELNEAADGVYFIHVSSGDKELAVLRLVKE